MELGFSWITNSKVRLIQRSAVNAGFAGVKLLFGSIFPHSSIVTIKTFRTTASRSVRIMTYSQWYFYLTRRTKIILFVQTLTQTFYETHVKCQEIAVQLMHFILDTSIKPISNVTWILKSSSFDFFFFFSSCCFFFVGVLLSRYSLQFRIRNLFDMHGTSTICSAT